MLVKSYRACFALSKEIKLTPELQALLLYIQNSQTIHTSISCAYLSQASGSAQCAADVSMTMRSRDKRAVKNARKQTSLFPMLFRFVFVIARLLQIGAARQQENR